MSPRLITFEGGEGSGKTTQVKFLAAWLAESGYSVLRTREPGGSAGAEAIRGLLLGRSGWDPVAEMALHFAARREHWAKTIAPSLAAGSFVVCDRFFDSTLAYQVAGQGAPRRTWEQLRAATLGTAAPDLTLYLDIPVELGLARAMARGDANRYDRLGLDFHERIRQSFLSQAAAEPGRIAVLDASRPLAEVSAAVIAVARGRLGMP
ncbi:dTMP kinase [Roseococcus sp. SDR]|uniref:dTMP kinase n=1 Tax=Roseococcus sp. SDR TaxID=2835532 RepID=UPI001BCCA9DF|nr:dTMP kinase [Roseococcus sp. SDR]MBS7791452.1 dTMP kinase [Roseococcus sp. SDR]MBV1846766.1 dTMP kinase [Roseococcus sp. SDR]